MENTQCYLIVHCPPVKYPGWTAANTWCYLDVAVLVEASGGGANRGNPETG